MILNKKQIEERLSHNPPMVSNLVDKNIQLQTTGLDLTIKNIFKFTSAGQLNFDNSTRKLSTKHIIKSRTGEYYLAPGSYQIELNEIFNMPLDVVGETISRSSLQRCGAAILTGYFDPGFIGNGVSLIEVYNQKGLFVSKNARICQMVFHLTEKTESYNGVYKNKTNGAAKAPYLEYGDEACPALERPIVLS